MPIGYSPDDVLEFEFAGVSWKSRALTVSQVRKIKALATEAIGKPFEQEQSLLNEAILMGVVGWNRSELFGVSAIDDNLTGKQKQEMAQSYPSLLYLSEIEKKVSRLSPVSAAASSVQDAPATDATTPPTN